MTRRTTTFRTIHQIVRHLRSSIPITGLSFIFLPSSSPGSVSGLLLKQPPAASWVSLPTIRARPFPKQPLPRPMSKPR